MPVETTETAGASRSRATRPITVLLVDDDETWARTQRRLLERHTDRLDVSTALSFADAQEHLTTETPDCVVCDYQLGDGTGLDLLAQVRADTPTLPFILVTGEGTEAVASDAISAKVTDYVRKAPLGRRPERLATRIENAVAADRTRQALVRERRSKRALLEMVTRNASRADFGHQVCTHLVSEHDYACAWVGVLDEQQSVVPLSTAGETGYVEATIEPGTRPVASDEPAFTALEASEIVVRPIELSRDSETATGRTREETAWAHAAVDFGFETAVALPIIHESDCFGVLCVYAGDGERIDDSALSLLADYAETVGYVFRTTSWRTALLSSAPTTVEFTLDDRSHPLLELGHSLPDDATLCARTVLPRADTEVLYLTEIDGVSSSEVRDAVAVADAIRSIDIEQPETDRTNRYGFVVASPSPESVLAGLGVSFLRTLVDGRQARIAVRVGTQTTVRDCVDTLSERMETDSITTRWALDEQSLIADEDGSTELTDRQRQALELAIEGGYFQRPRLHNTSELAAALGVSRATYTQHLRAAQRKVFASCEWRV